MKKIVCILLGIIFIFTGCATKKPAETTTINESTSTNVVEESTVVTAPQLTDTETVTLNTGAVINLGDTIEMQNPSYYEVSCAYTGVVGKMYPETGNVLLRSKMSVIEFNYRQVIDIQGISETCGYDGPPETKPVNLPLRGVVYLDDKGEEHVHFIRSLEEGAASRVGMKISDMSAYEPLKFYEVLFNEENVPQDILDFYNSI